jgi:hypothetical protein
MFNYVSKKRTRKNTRKNNEQLTGDQSSALRNMEEYAKNIRPELSEKMAMFKEEAQKKTRKNNTRKNRFERNSPKKSRKKSRKTSRERHSFHRR